MTVESFLWGVLTTGCGVLLGLVLASVLGVI